MSWRARCGPTVTSSFDEPESAATARAALAAIRGEARSALAPFEKAGEQSRPTPPGEETR